MYSQRKAILFSLTCSLVVTLCVPAIAQQSADIAPQSADIVSPDQAGEASAPQKSTAAQTSSGTGFLGSDADLTDNKWHVYGTGYLWIPGIHGTVGVRGFDTSVHVTAGEIFSNFRGGLLGVFTPTYNRFSAPIDFMWMRLKDSRAIPFAHNYSVQALLNVSIATPKVSYLLLNNPKIKIYGTAGPRIWHVGTTLNLSPTILGRSLYSGPTWVDFVAGARFSLPLGSKASVDILGDGGEGGRDPGLPGRRRPELSSKAKILDAGRLAVPYRSLRQQRESLEHIDSGHRHRRDVQV